MSVDAWQRVVQMRAQEGALRARLRGAGADVPPDERRMWAAIMRLERALERLVRELEELMSVRQSVAREQEKQRKQQERRRVPSGPAGPKRRG
jgi:hypothetical protein